MLYFYRSILLLSFLFNFNVYASDPEVFVFLGGDSPMEKWNYLNHPEIKGAQVIYSWRRLEPKKNSYNIKPILDDLKFLQKHNKKLFIQIQDRSFSVDNIPVPDYLLEKEYDGGVAKQIDFAGEGEPVGYGWVAKQWNSNVRERFQKLLSYLGNNLDGRITGINLPETAIDVNGLNSKKREECDKYFFAIIDNMRVLKKSFPNSYTVQYVNFIPGEWNDSNRYMSRLFKYAVKNHIGLGNPDTVPYRPGQMKNSYQFFNKYKGKLEITAIAVQEPDYTYINPKTSRKFTVEELYTFVKNYLGADIVFWNIEEPQFSKQLIPMLSKISE